MTKLIEAVELLFNDRDVGEMALSVWVSFFLVLILFILVKDGLRPR